METTGTVSTPLNRAGRMRGLLIGILLLLAIPLAIAATMAGVGQVGKPFEGFLMQRAGYLAPYQRGDWAGLKAGLRPEDVVVAVDGQPVAGARTVHERVRSARPGDVVHYEIVRQGARKAFAVPVTLYTWQDLGRDFLGIGVVGLLYLLIGGIAGWLRPDVPAARGVWFLGLVAGTFCLTYFDANSTYHVAFFCVASISAIGAAFMYLAMIFPQEIGIVRRFPRAAWVPFIVGTGFAAANWIGYLSPGLAVTTPARFEAAYSAIRLSTVWLFLGMLTYLALLPVHYLRAGRRTLARQQAVICLGGAVLAFAPVALLYGVPFALERAPLLTLDWLLAGIVMFPLSIAYAIVRHRLFDIAVVVRRSVLYTALTLILGSVYVLVSTALEQGILLGSGLGSHEAGLLATALVVGIFGPVRDRLRREIDRRFFRQAYDAQRIVEDVSASLLTLVDLETITNRILQAAQEALHASGGALYLHDAGADVYRPAAWLKGPRPGPLPGGQGIVRELERGEILTRVILPVQKRHRVSDELRALEADIVVPLGAGRVHGFLALGPKLSEKPYNDSDLALLAILANQGAVAVANALRFAELKRTRDSLARADKLAALGTLAAGVAHELNTPLGVLRGQLQLLAHDDNREDVDRINRQVTRMERVVKDLLAFGHDGPAQFREVDARDLVTRVTELMRLDSRFRRMHVEIGIGRDLPPIWGDPGRLEQVFLNLLSNAAHATRDHDEPAIAIRGWLREGHVAIAVEDNGCGIDEADVGRIFDPFFTTKRVGEGTGLGLSVTFGIVEEHGGTIEAESRPGEGTRMLVRLPAAPAKARAD